MKRYKIDKNKSDKYPKFPVGYGKKLVVMVPYPENPREGVCDSCLRSKRRGEINVSHLHHHKYQYKHNTLKKDPYKVLENLSELCFTCHTYADSLRTLVLRTKEEKLWMIIHTGLLMPLDMKKKMDRVARMWLKARENDVKVELTEFFDVEDG